MLKLVADTPEGPLYAFGLSLENIKRLKRGKPIAIELRPMGCMGRVLIFYGATERAMMAELREFIGPDTQVTVDPRVTDG